MHTGLEQFLHRNNHTKKSPPFRFSLRLLCPPYTGARAPCCRAPCCRVPCCRAPCCRAPGVVRRGRRDRI
ncbi:hypothetical protein MBAV_005352 [Candidatus Magnetobacterium bavaricum]|uniref:Uncharacterized protein n=1 Tax=Candidatus Magnetobacterium bavaricum TaxID=29290 RepID=A0A0F3GKN7_9BACT|nr:hypothetical protein MBAV_005352 [Candidatus Magnetobacterium bavaricum]